MNEILILDSYLDEIGAWRNFVDLMPGRSYRAVRVAREEPPRHLDSYAGVMLTGSAASAVDGEPWLDRVYDLIREAHERRLPTLGICFGHQLIARALCGSHAVRRSPTSELGWLEIRRTADNPIFDGIPTSFPCFVSHFDEVTPGLEGLDVFAASERCAVQGYQVIDAPMWGLQFHPEMPLEESTRLIHSNASRHAHIHETAAELLSKAVDSRAIGTRLFENFLRHAPLSKGDA
ncbi:MAG: type 1 glutamine amidotransferase [Planctomycetes bacterium]|nr:type 1 glutamine amidotransferase [Planctomycetota bacterium]MCB9904448.1 type 1 glutamine amidotransferase [Planctomycetota bacterium]